MGTQEWSEFLGEQVQGYGAPRFPCDLVSLIALTRKKLCVAHGERAMERAFLEKEWDASRASGLG